MAGFSVAVGACGSSTAPALTNPGQLAAHFDSLANADNCATGGGGANLSECALINFAHLGVALDVPPSAIRMTINARAANWFGYGSLQRYAGRAPGSIDTVYTVVAYDGDNLGSAVALYVPLNWGGYSLASINSSLWGTQFDAQSGTGSASVISVGGQCTLTDNTGPFRPDVRLPLCQKASIRLTTDVTFSTFTGDSSMTISIPSQTMNGFVLDTAY